MSWQFISLDSIAGTPWRNGGGTTQELAAFPPQGDWRWRMSVARVDRAGPFSAFEGVERWFAVLSGAGVRLQVDGASHELTAHTPPLRFDGGAPAHCTLLDGPTQDFNLMVRGKGGRMARIDGEAAFDVAPSTTVALWSGPHPARAQWDGDAIGVPRHALAWRRLEAGGRLEVRARDGLWMEIAP
jgi:environmental stress-induced protein Ves